MRRPGRLGPPGADAGVLRELVHHPRQQRGAEDPQLHAETWPHIVATSRVGPSTCPRYSHRPERMRAATQLPRGDREPPDHGGDEDPPVIRCHRSRQRQRQRQSE